MPSYAKEYVTTGIMGVVAIAAVTGAVMWFRGTLMAGKETSFVVRLPDARGLKGAEEVRIAGFRVGRVGKVGLSPDGRAAEVELLVDTKYPIPADSKIQVNPPLLGGIAFISIAPGSSGATTLKEGDKVVGSEAAGLDSLAADANKIIGDEKVQEDLKATIASVRQSTAALNGLLTDPNLKRTMRNLSAASSQLPETLAQTNHALAQANALITRVGGDVEDLTGSAKHAMKNVDRLTDSGAGVAQETERTIATVRGTLQENREGIKEMLKTTNDAMAGLAALTDQASQLVGDQDLRKNFVKTTENINKLTETANETMKKLDATAENIRKLSGDEQITTDAKATLGNVKEASASIQRLMARIEKIRLPGEPRTGPPRPKTPPQPSAFTSLVEPGLILDSNYDTTSERYRLDANYSLLSGDHGFYRVGIAGATEGNKLNFQLGSFARLPVGSALRYGLFAGKLGVGADARAQGIDWRLDVFDPNRFTVNLRAKKYLNSDSAFLLGLDSVGHGNRVTVGYQMRR
ncbi:MAG: MlaD family protein [Armatimonas sp.]